VPRVLIADDDPVSLHFLASAVGDMDCSVLAAASAAEALTLSGLAAVDLLLLDRRMPDMGGVELLAALRGRGVRAPALATSAEVDATIGAQLRAGGFLEVIAKPLSIEALHAQLLPYLGSGEDAPARASLLDDAGANAAVGSNLEALRALRQLFVAELTEIESAWTRGEPKLDIERLHRLRASCGFCGASALAEAARRLEQALRDEPASVAAPLGEFLRLCRMTRDALVSAATVR